MNKKGVVPFNAFLVIFFIIMFVVALQIYSGRGKNVEGVVGESSVEIINLYLKAEKDLFYLDNEVKLNSYKVLKGLSNEEIICNEDCLDGFKNLFLEKFHYEDYNCDLEIVDDGFFVIGRIDDKKEYKFINKDGIEVTYNVGQNFKQKINFKVDNSGQRILTENGFEIISLNFKSEEEELNL